MTIDSNNENISDNEINEIFSELHEGVIIPDTLYHYTDVDGFFGILNERSFWLSNHVYLNDSQEIIDGANHFTNLIENLENDEFKNSISKIMSNNDFKRLFSYNFCSYIISFTEINESKSQWKEYANDAKGFCIGFHYESLKKITDNSKYEIDYLFESSTYTYKDSMIFGKVIYSKERKNEVLEKCINDAKRKYYMEVSNIDDVQKKDVLLMTIIVGLINKVSRIVSMFKNNCYQDESEWRLVVQQPIIHEHSIVGSIKKVKYRNRNGIIVPFYIFDNLPIHSIISKITIGPKYPDKNEIGIKSFVRSLGLNINIVKSNVPLQ